MTNEITKRTEGESGVGHVSHVVSGVEGIDEFKVSQIKIPRLILIQGMTQNVGDGQPGQWLLRSTGRVYGDAVRLVLISHFRSRVLFFKDETVPACTSLDGKVPERGESPPDPNGVVARACDRCFYSLRQPDPKNDRKRLPAPCADQSNFLGFVLHPEDSIEDRQLCVVQFKRTSYACGDAILSHAQLNAPRVAQATKKSAALWSYVYELRSRAAQWRLGKGFEPVHRFVDFTDRLYPGIDDEARGYRAGWTTIREMLARESVARDQDDAGEAPDEAAPAAATGDSSKTSAPPTAGKSDEDGLPF